MRDLAFLGDWENMKTDRFVKDKDDLKAVGEIMRVHFGVIQVRRAPRGRHNRWRAVASGPRPARQAIFKHYAAVNTSNPFSLTWMAFTELMNVCHIPDLTTCKLAVRVAVGHWMQ